MTETERQINSALHTFLLTQDPGRPTKHAFDHCMDVCAIYGIFLTPSKSARARTLDV
jgi:hypothetical protein